MNGREKSDSAEVAVKPANKTGMPAAEQVEPRAGTEGNAIPQSTSRTQGRADASQARDRIRVAARRNKKEKFTALLHESDFDSFGQTCDSVRWTSRIFLPPRCADVAAESSATCRRSNRFCVEHWSKHTSAVAGRTATASTGLGTGPNDICPSASLERAAGSAEIMCQTTSTNGLPI